MKYKFSMNPPEIYDIETIGKNLGLAMAKIRIEKDLSQKQASMLCGLHQSMFCQYEGTVSKTRNFLPNFHTMLKICNGLGVTVDELFKIAMECGK